MGYWDEKRKYEESKNQRGAITIRNCSWCGAPLKIRSNIIQFIRCQNHLFSKGAILCDKCAKKCKKCRRHFCPKHIKKHKCK